MKESDNKLENERENNKWKNERESDKREFGEIKPVSRENLEKRRNWGENLEKQRT